MDRVPLITDTLTSLKTQLPLPVKAFPCQSESEPVSRSLGQALSGLSPQTTGYEVPMKQDLYCQILCELNMESTNHVIERMVLQGYYQNFVLDGLPAASGMENEFMIFPPYVINTLFWRGIPLGFVASGKVYVNNHVNIIVQFHDVGDGKYQITRFRIQPFSVQHKVEYEGGTINLKNSLKSCDHSDDDSTARSHTSYEMITTQGRMPQGLSTGQVIFTYDVVWEENYQVTWSKRWDIYVTMDKAIPAQIHWFSLLNSSILVAILLGMVLAVLRNNVGKLDSDDPANEADEQLESLYDKGYTIVYSTHFAPPEDEMSALLFSLCCGAGAQLLATMLTTVLLASAVDESCFSSNGRIVVCQLVLFALFGCVNGFVSMQTSKFFKTDFGWKIIALACSLGFPVLTLVLFLIRQIIASIYESSLVLSVSHQVIVLRLWLVLMSMLMFIGSYIGHRVESILSIPTTQRSVVLRLVNYRAFQQRDWQVKCRYVTFASLLNVALVPLLIFWCIRKWLGQDKKRWRPSTSGLPGLLVSGAVGGAVVYVELYLILSSFWLRFYYTTYPFILTMVILYMASCAAVSILLSFTQLTVENSHSWWQQFCCGGFSVIWFLILSFRFMLQLELSQLSSVLLFLGYTIWLAICVLLVSGFVSFAASAWFAQTLFSIAEAG